MSGYPDDPTGCDVHVAHDIVRDMQAAAPPLMPVFRSTLQALLLALVLSAPEQRFTVAGLATALGADLATVSRETTRLVAAGVLREERQGRTRILSANTESPVYEELTSLAVKTFGPAQLARDTFANLPGVSAVVVFGSWAARFAGRKGPAPRDLDVLLVGAPSSIAANRAADQLSERIGLPVQVVVVLPVEWENASVHLVREIKAGPHLEFAVQAQP